MERTITLTIPANYLAERRIEPEELRRALMLGLTLLHRKDIESADLVAHALMSTGRIHRLMPADVSGETSVPSHQPPLSLPGTPASEILIAQRRGEL